MTLDLASSQTLLNRLRGFLALSIIWHHLQPVQLIIFDKVDLYFLISVPGRVIVWMFFVLSGYGIYYSYINKKYRLTVKEAFRFYFNRAIRILPLFYLTALIYWILVLYNAPLDLPDWQTIVKSLFFLDMNLYTGINAFTPSWFVGVIVHFYLLAPLLVALYIYIYKKVRLVGMFVILVAVSIVLHKFGYYCAGSYDIRNIIGNLSLFFWGFFAYCVYYDQSPIREVGFKVASKRIAFLISVLIYFEIIFYIYSFNRGNFWIKPFEAIVGIGSVLLIQYILYSDRKRNALVNPYARTIKYLPGKVFSKLGERSYGLYLWHGIVIVILSKVIFLGSKGPPFLLLSTKIIFFICTTTASYLLSAVFFYILEKPFQRLYKGIAIE